MMPVAKKRKLADALGMSTLVLSQSGLPLSLVSANANAPRFSSISSAMRFRILNLSSTGEVLHPGKAFLAAKTAASTSFLWESGICPYTCPVAGLMLSIKFPLRGPMRLPPM
jgi:hypothetical protein